MRPTPGSEAVPIDNPVRSRIYSVLLVPITTGLAPNVPTNRPLLLDPAERMRDQLPVVCPNLVVVLLGSPAIAKRLVVPVELTTWKPSKPVVPSTCEISAAMPPEGTAALTIAPALGSTVPPP